MRKKREVSWAQNETHQNINLLPSHAHDLLPLLREFIGASCIMLSASCIGASFCMKMKSNMMRPLDVIAMRHQTACVCALSLFFFPVHQTAFSTFVFSSSFTLLWVLCASRGYSLFQNSREGFEISRRDFGPPPTSGYFGI